MPERLNVPVQDESAPYDGTSWLEHQKDDDTGNEYHSGYRKTKWGIVTIHLSKYSNSTGRFQWYLFQTVIGGRQFSLRETRTPSRFITTRGASMLAARWVRELAR